MSNLSRKEKDLKEGYTLEEFDRKLQEAFDEFGITVKKREELPDQMKKSNEWEVKMIKRVRLKTKKK